MTDINTVIIVGRLTRDAELKYTNTGTAVSKISLAVNRGRKNGDQWTEEVSFFDAVLWGRMAESLQQYLVKGKQIIIEGELRQNKWEQDGQTRSKVEIVVKNLQLLGGGGSGQGTGSSGAGSYGGGQQRNQGKQTQEPPQGPPDENDGGYNEKFEDDIPF